MPPGQKIDPQLKAQLEGDDAGTVEAVLRLRSPDEKRRFPTPDETESLARRLLEETARSTGTQPVDYSVFRNLASFVVVAPRDFLRALLEHADVAGATLNRRQESSHIAPVRKRPLSEGGSGKESA
jgi:hypothetical protein